MKNTTQQPLKQIWTGPIDKSGEFHSAYMGKDLLHRMADWLSVF